MNRADTIASRQRVHPGPGGDTPSENQVMSASLERFSKARTASSGSAGSLVRVANDITSEVGSPGDALQNAQIIQVTSLRLLPGKRAKQLDFIKQMREARNSAGLVTATILEQVVGDASLLHLAWGYADLDAWAKDRAAGAPKGFGDIQKHALADPQWPYSEPVATRVYADITKQL